MSMEASAPVQKKWPAAADVPRNANPSLRDLHAEVVSAVIAGEGLSRVAELTATAAGGPVIIVLPELGGPWVGPREHLVRERLAALEVAVIDHLSDPSSAPPSELAWEVPIAGERLNGVVALLRTDEQPVRPGARVSARGGAGRPDRGRHRRGEILGRGRHLGRIAEGSANP